MKALLAVLLGLAVGVAVSACSCGLDITFTSISAGSFVPSAYQSQPNGDPVDPEPDYRLVVADDKQTLTESFTRGGKHYVMVYQVTTTRQSDYRW